MCCIAILYILLDTNNIIKRIKVKQCPSNTRSYARVSRMKKKQLTFGNIFLIHLIRLIGEFRFSGCCSLFAYRQFSIAYQLHVCSSDGCQWWTVATPHRSDVLYYPWWSVDAVPSCGGVETSRGQEFWRGQSVGLPASCCPIATP